MFVMVKFSGETVVMLPDMCHRTFSLPGSPVNAGPKITPSWPDSGSPAICACVTNVPGLVAEFACDIAGLANVIAAAGVTGYRVRLTGRRDVVRRGVAPITTGRTLYICSHVACLWQCAHV